MKSYRTLKLGGHLEKTFSAHKTKLSTRRFPQLSLVRKVHLVERTLITLIILKETPYDIRCEKSEGLELGTDSSFRATFNLALIAINLTNALPALPCFQLPGLHQLDGIRLPRQVGKPGRPQRPPPLAQL